MRVTLSESSELEGTPSEQMQHDNLLQLQKQLALQAKEIERPAKRIAELEAELKQDGKPKKQKSQRRR